MKNLYLMDIEEKNRILNLHENTTKKQSLIESPESDYLVKLPKETQDKFYKLGVSWKALGTNPNNLLAALKTFTANDLKLYNNYLATIKPEGHTSFQGIINGEMEYGNLQDVINITNELKRLGVNATYKTISKDKNGKALATPGFETNSFRTGGAVSPVVTQPKVAPVTVQPKVKQPTPQQRRQQINQKTQNTTKEIQKLLGQDQTGNLDSINVEKMISVLNQ